MKKVIRVIGVDGKITEGSVNLRNEELFRESIKYKAQVYRPKKGKGSYKRNKKVVY